MRSSRAVQRRRLSTITSSSRLPSSARIRPVLSLGPINGTSSSSLPPRRSLYTSPTLLKQKRWENSAQKAEGEENEQGEERSEAVASDDPVNEREATEQRHPAKEQKVESSEAPETEAESSQAAQQRAKRSSRSSTSGANSSTPESPSSNSNAAPPRTGTEITKPDAPEVYPQLLALPLTHRPLFPTFYKAVTIHNPSVINAVRELIAHGQPYLGAFLLKDSDADSDVITSPDEVHPVGIFCQITSTFESNIDKDAAKDAAKKSKTGKAGVPPLTIILYPVRRIRMDELVTEETSQIRLPSRAADSKRETVPIASVVEEVQKDQKDESEVASFEKEDVPSVEAVQKDVGQPITSERLPSSPVPADHILGDTASIPIPPFTQIGFLHSLLPQVAIANVTNFKFDKEPADKQMTRALVAEMINVFKDLAAIQPIFREQSELLRY